MGVNGAWSFNTDYRIFQVKCMWKYRNKYNSLKWFIIHFEKETRAIVIQGKVDTVHTSLSTYTLNYSYLTACCQSNSFIFTQLGWKF